MRILAIDPGEKRLGVAMSDPTATIASPLTVVDHTSRTADATAIIILASQHEAGLIVIGEALDEEGNVGFQARKAIRLAEAIRSQSSIPVVLWDESGSTETARQARIAMGVSRQKRKGHLDNLAATVILQSYLDAHSETKNPSSEVR
jgi:putative holliday junction resolvase